MTGHRKIGVLLGGLSAERDVSIRSGEAILTALADRGHDAVPIFVDRDIDLVLRQTRIDVAFLALHGRYGEDGCVQGLLEVLGIPYTGSGVLASGLAMNKGKAKEIFRLHNLPTAPGLRHPGGLGRGRHREPRLVRVPGRRQARRRGLVARHQDRARRARARDGRRGGAALRRRRPRRALHRRQGDLGGRARRQGARRRRGRAASAASTTSTQVHGGPHRLPPAGAPVARALPLGAAARDAGARRARLRGRDARRSHRERARQRGRARGQHAARA